MMFRKRRNSQQPSEAFYSYFKDAYPSAHIARESSPPRSKRASFSQVLADEPIDGLPEDLLQGLSHHFRQNLPDPPFDQEIDLTGIFTNIQDPDLTPQASHDSWMSTPPEFSLNPLEFPTTSDQFQKFYKPINGWAASPRETMASYQYASGAKTGIEASLRTPHSLFDPEHGLRNARIGNTVHLESQSTLLESHLPFEPNNVLHRPSDFNYATNQKLRTQMEDIRTVNEVQLNPPIMHPPSQLDAMCDPPDDSVMLQRLRFRVKLNASTAMTESAEEIPVTYLNKGQIYLMSISDTRPPKLGATLVQYRTSIRISFEGEEQEQGRNTRWQLWKDGRGAKEADQRGGKFQGVEYIEVQQAIGYNGRVEHERSSVDGFSVLWSQESCTSADCHIAVRFNFLSTDFSYAKGVRGISCRFCAKTTVVSPQPQEIVSEIPEISFCEVKLFRDHGSERKHVNDIVHANKAIAKIKQQIAKVDVGMANLERRKHRALIAANGAQCSASHKISSHKRACLSSSKSVAEEGLHLKLSILEAKLFSTRPVSILDFRGQAQDDPDRLATLLIDKPRTTAQIRSEETLDPRRRVTNQSPRKSSHSESPALGQRIKSEPAPSASLAVAHMSNPQHLASPPSEHMDVEKAIHNDSKILRKSVEELEEKSSSRCAAPRERLNSVACFYTLYPSPSTSSTTPKEENYRRQKHYYQAIYLSQRTANNLATSIAGRYDFFRPVRSIVRMTHISAMKPGIEITVDDDFVRELREGQDMVLEWKPVGVVGTVRDEGGCDEEYVLRLIF